MESAPTVQKEASPFKPELMFKATIVASLDNQFLSILLFSKDFGTQNFPC